MKIDIDDEMLALAEKYDGLLTSPDFDADSMKEYEETRSALMVMLMAKIETEKMYQRITA